MARQLAVLLVGAVKVPLATRALPHHWLHQRVLAVCRVARVSRLVLVHVIVVWKVHRGSEIN